MSEKKYQVFVSSTYKDLTEERWVAMQALLSVDCIISGMELFPAIDLEQFEYIKQIIDDCDYYLLILGGKYGSISETTGLSYTEMEYDYAISRGLRVIALLHKDPDALQTEKREIEPERLAKFQKFRIKVSKERLVRFWSSTTEIDSLVTKGMFHLTREFPAIGWVRANRVASEELLTENAHLRKEIGSLTDIVQLLESRFKEQGAADLPDLSADSFILEGRFNNETIGERVTLEEVFQAAFTCSSSDLI